MRQLHERDDWEQGRKEAHELRHWQPGQTIKNRIRIEAGHTVGKCGIITDMITTSDGKRQAMGDLVGKEFMLPTLLDGQVIHLPARAELNKYEPVYKLTTLDGRNITRNAHHPVWAARGKFERSKRPVIDVLGWTPVTDLQPGDLVALAECLPEPIDPVDMPIEQVKLLAYLIGDGGTSRKHCVRFSQIDNVQLAEFKACAESMGCVVDYVGQYDYIVYGKNRRAGQHNPVLDMCRAHGLMGALSKDKRIPSAVFRLPTESLRVFLSRLYSTDGWATSRKDGGVEIGFASSSHGLVRDIQELLLRFGLHGRLYYKQAVNSWTLSINAKLDAYRFAQEIGIYGKEDAIEQVKAACAYRVESHARATGDRPSRPRWQHKNATPGTRWEKIESVEYVGEEWTVAIEVSGTHTYLTEFWEHNTKLAGGIFSHFFDTCTPSIIYTFAPSWEQINDLLWKEIRTDRRRGNLPGRVLDGKPQLNHKPNHFAKGRATSNAHGRGTERVQGQHNKYQMFVLDEAEGIEDYVWRAVESMASGGIAIVLMLANPRTRNSQFHKQRSRADVANFRISCLWHPNVLEDRDVVPGAVRRDYVLRMLESHAEPTPAHDPDAHTFDLPFDAAVSGRVYPAGTAFRPDAEFMFRVLGIAPANIADDTFVPSGRFEAATQREPDGAEPHKARMGVDAARYGTDMGTLYVRHAGAVWRAAQFAKQDGYAYYVTIREEAQRLRAQGVTSLHVRVDAGGGFGGSVTDHLNHDPDLHDWFDDFEVVEVHFNAEPMTPEAYDDLVTEMYADVGESLKGLALVDVPEALEADFTERPYRWVNRQGRAVKKLTDKESFRKAKGRSPDDGDGCVLAVASDFLFDSGVTIAGLGSLYGQR